MTCKHLKSSRAYNLFKKSIYVDYKSVFGDTTNSDWRSSVLTDIPVIRTICADCGKVLKEVKIIEK